MIILEAAHLSRSRHSTPVNYVKCRGELVAHRRNVHIGDPSLPQRAGRAYARFMRGEKAKVGYSITPSGRAISVRPLARPEPDVKLLARVFLGMAMRDLEEKSKNQAA